MTEPKEDVKDEQSSGRTRWRKGCSKHSWFDWFNVISTLFVPLIVGILTIVLPLQQQNLSDRQTETSKIIAMNTRLKDAELMHDQQKQTILDSYERDLTDLLVKYRLDDENDDDERLFSLVVRAKTLHALRQLDPARKILLVQLLVDTDVQNRINMSYADLSSLIFPKGSIHVRLQFVGIVARNTSFKNIYLYQSNFSLSTLDESSFRDSNCSYVDFSYASLQRTDWTNADVTHASFNYTNLKDALITTEQLAKVQSLDGAILPNGSVHHSTLSMASLNKERTVVRK